MNRTAKHVMFSLDTIFMVFGGIELLLRLAASIACNLSRESYFLKDGIHFTPAGVDRMAALMLHSFQEAGYLDGKDKEIS